MIATLETTFRVDGQSSGPGANCHIACAGVYPRSFAFSKKDGPQDLEVSIDIDLAAGIFIFVGCRMQITVPGLAPFEVRPERPVIWMRDTIFACPFSGDIKTLRAEILDGTDDAEYHLHIRVPELAKRIVKAEPAKAPTPASSLAMVAAVDPPFVISESGSK